MRNTFLMLWIILMGTLLLLVSCSEKTGPMEAPPEFTIEAFQVPTMISIDRPRTYTVAFRVTHPGGIEKVSEITVTVLGGDQSTILLEFPLYDDGGVLHPEDGDVVASDGIYSNTFVSDSTIFSVGNFFLQARAVDANGDSRTTPFISASAIVNAAPVLLSIDAPDTLFSGTDPVLFSAMVQDSNGVADIAAMNFLLKRGGNLIVSGTMELISSSAPDSGVFGVFLDSTFAAERLGNYDLEFQAVDLSGDGSATLSKPIFLENAPPYLAIILLPDSVQRPPLGSDIIDVQVRGNDPQGLGDINMINMAIFRIGGDTTVIELFDDGDFDNHRDEQAGDGIFSRGLQVAANSTADLFFFEFQAEDKVGNVSPVVLDSLRILP